MIEKYTKKPITIEAVQLLNTRESIIECDKFLDENKYNNLWDKESELYLNELIKVCQNNNGMVVSTVSGHRHATFGDYIIQDIRDDILPTVNDGVSREGNY